MASAATTRIFGGDPTNIPAIFGQKFDSKPNANAVPIVFLVGDATSEQEALASLVGREGWQFETFESAREFLARPRPLVASCLILALSPLALDGHEVQTQLARERTEVPIVVISGHGDIPTSVQAMKAGAIDFFLKPFRNDDLLSAIREGFERSRMALDREMEGRDLRNCYALLSCRERQVMALVVSGLLNKQVGGELGISEITVKAHRRQVMRKMKANSLPDLVRMATELKPARRLVHMA